MPTSKQIEEAKQTLTNAGYFTDNLWHVSDVKENFERYGSNDFRIRPNKPCYNGAYLGGY